MSRYYSLETIRANAYDVTLANGAKHRCIDPDALLDIEPADVRENVKGKWLQDKHDEAGYGYFDCSVCGADFYDVYDFCPNCGADMRGET